MAFDPVLAAIRFGYGRHPHQPDPARPEDLLKGLAGPDTMARRYPIARFETFVPVLQDVRTLSRANRQDGPSEERRAQISALRRDLRRSGLDMARAMVARTVDSPTPLRERLVAFWADHFTVIGKNALTRPLVPAFIDDAIRPYVAGRFADLLRAALGHRLMLAYLDQTPSVGPNSLAAKRNPKRGLNENLAREALELHTLGVQAPYDQGDVRALARLFAGMRPGKGGALRLAARAAEPGPKRFLGKTYGGGKPRLADIDAALEDLAMHPATARHIAHKLAVHFVADRPEPALVTALEAAFTRSGGDLSAVYAALVAHPAAQSLPLSKAKRPFEFIGSALRGLGAPGKDLMRLDRRMIQAAFLRPMAAMGQTWLTPNGPDGWPEAASYWVTPQGLAARISWAMAVAERMEDKMPDPRDLVGQLLGPLASERLHFAAQAAETKFEGVAIVLAAPEFQKR